MCYGCCSFGLKQVDLASYVQQLQQGLHVCSRCCIMLSCSLLLLPLQVIMFGKKFGGGE
jgi:hypothetical protein